MPIKGESLWPALTGKALSFHANDYFTGWEVLGWGAARQGNWKLLLEKPPFGTKNYQLYHLTEDPGEVNDLAEVYPEKYEQSLQRYSPRPSTCFRALIRES